MKSNLLYRAIDKLSRQLENRSVRISRHNSSSEANQRRHYFYITVPEADRVPDFILDGKRYLLHKSRGRQPHITVYDRCDDRNEHLTAAHFTFYLERDVEEEADAAAAAASASASVGNNKRLIVRVFYDSSGVFKACHVAPDYPVEETNESFELSGANISLFMRVANQQALAFLTDLLQKIYEEQGRCRAAFSKAFGALQAVLPQRATHKAHYQRLSIACQKALKELNYWLPERDPRTMTVNILTADVPEPASTEYGSASFFDPLAEDDGEDDPADTTYLGAGAAGGEIRPADVRVRVTVARPRRKETAASVVDPEVAAAIVEKQRLLRSLEAATDSNVLDAVTAINKHDTVIFELFEKRALAGDVEAVKVLLPHIFELSPVFFCKLVMCLHTEVITLVVNRFPIAAKYVLNFLTFGMPEQPSKEIPVLCHLIEREGSLATFEQLLGLGANPDYVFPGESGEMQTLLQFAVYHGGEAYVMALLKYGANIDKHKFTHRLIGRDLDPSMAMPAVTQAVDSGLRALRASPQDSIAASSVSLLGHAIVQKRDAIAEMLLDHGADPNEDHVFKTRDDKFEFHFGTPFMLLVMMHSFHLIPVVQRAPIAVSPINYVLSFSMLFVISPHKLTVSDTGEIKPNPTATAILAPLTRLISDDGRLKQSQLTGVLSDFDKPARACYSAKNYLQSAAYFMAIALYHPIPAQKITGILNAIASIEGLRLFDKALEICGALSVLESNTTVQGFVEKAVPRIQAKQARAKAASRVVAAAAGGAGALHP